MKESISYTFLLNTVIIFIFVCLAIVMGIFSYYRAFKANTIIINAIEKYEGYNCLAQDEIARKLGTASYQTPFDVDCKDRYGKPCTTDTGRNYAVVSYNLDYNEGNFIGDTDDFDVEPDDINMNGKYDGNGNMTKRYQYGVYTYMYVDMPVISGMLKIPFFAKTRTMYDFRDMYISRSYGENGNKFPDVAYDANYINNFEKLLEESRNTNKSPLYMYADELLESYLVESIIGGVILNPDYNARIAMQNTPLGNQKVTGDDATHITSGYPYECGYVRNYSDY